MDLFWLMAIIIALIAIGIAFYWFTNSAKKDDLPSVSKPVEKDHLQELLVLNLTLRKSPISADLIEATEAVIDQLVELLPKIDEIDSPSGDLAWTVKRIASEYLPNKCIHPYLKLSPQDRLSPQVLDQFKKNIAGLSQELESVSDTLSRRDSAEFSAKAKFLSQKFNADGGA